MQKVRGVLIALCCGLTSIQAGPTSHANAFLGRCYRKHVAPYMEAAWNMSFTTEQAIMAAIGVTCGSFCAYKSPRMLCAGIGAAMSMLSFHALYQGAEWYAASAQKGDRSHENYALSRCLCMCLHALESQKQHQSNEESALWQACQDVASRLQQWGEHTIEMLSPYDYQAVREYLSQAQDTLTSLIQQLEQGEQQRGVEVWLTQLRDVLRETSQQLSQASDSDASETYQEDTEVRSYMTWITAAGLMGACAGYGFCQAGVDLYQAYRR